jgi:hypothetical protein
MKDLGYQKDYKWEANSQHAKGFLPPELSGLQLFDDNTN